MGSPPAFTVFLAEPDCFLLRLYEFVRSGGNVDARIEPGGRAIVHEAFDRLDLEALMYLSDLGVSLEVSRDGESYLLHEALDLDLDVMTQNGLPLVLAWTRLLLGFGADPTVRTNDGRTIQDLCARYGPDALALLEREIERHRSAQAQRPNRSM